MAKLPPETSKTINQLRQQLLDIIHEATATEFILFERYGETESTLIVLAQLKNLSQKASSSLKQINGLQLGIAEAQPFATDDMLRLLSQSIINNQNRIPAWQRSLEEVKLDWQLP